VINKPEVALTEARCRGFHENGPLFFLFFRLLKRNTLPFPCLHIYFFDYRFDKKPKNDMISLGVGKSASKKEGLLMAKMAF